MYGDRQVQTGYKRPKTFTLGETCCSYNPNIKTQQGKTQANEEKMLGRCNAFEPVVHRRHASLLQNYISSGRMFYNFII